MAAFNALLKFKLEARADNYCIKIQFVLRPKTGLLNAPEWIIMVLLHVDRHVRACAPLSLNWFF